MKKKALFLDRDGVINIDKVHTFKIDDFEFIKGIFDLCKTAILNNYIIIVITNQSGISRKLYTEEDFAQLTEYMLRKFKEKNINITKVYHCSYHPDFPIEEFKNMKNHRKPSPGMIFDARDDFNIDLQKSILIGDKLSDIRAGINAGITKNILLSNKKINFTKPYFNIKDLSAESISSVFI